jgi:hypothetical protein
MLHTTVVRRVLLLLISALVLLSNGHAASASAENNIWTSIGPEGGTVFDSVLFRQHQPV